MRPEEFFESFVRLNYEDCVEKPGDIRRAFNAAVSASHFADQYYNFNSRIGSALVSNYHNLGSFVEELTNRTNQAFKDIRSISNAYKHLYTDISPQHSAHSSVSSSGSIEIVELPKTSDISSLQEDYSIGNEETEGSVRWYLLEEMAAKLIFYRY